MRMSENAVAKEKPVRPGGFFDRIFQLLIRQLESWSFETLDRDQRVELVQRLETGAYWSFSFGFMTALSTAIASLGLIQDSTAIVIGAMVVAPLMTPLVAAGLGLVQGNLQIFRESLKTVSIGVGLALFVSIFFGLVVPQSDVSSELLARAFPNVLDLAVAFFAGAAAAYAVARPELLGALSGVAIAVALVPPLAACGIGTADAFWALAQGAGLLFLSNMVAIILGAATVFRLFSLHQVKPERATGSWIRSAYISLILMALLLSAPLGHRFMLQFSEGNSRPVAYPLTGKVAGSIRSFLRPHRNIHFVFGARQLEGREMIVKIFLSSNRAVESNFRDLFFTHLGQFYAEGTAIDLHIFQEVEGSQANYFKVGPQGAIESN